MEEMLSVVGRKRNTRRSVASRGHGREPLFRVSVGSVNGVLRREGNAGGPANPAPTDYNVISMADPVVTDNPAEPRFEIGLGSTLLGHARYVDKGGRRIFVHTEIDPAHEGHGYASTLVRAALDDARAHETLIVPLCPYVAYWIERHPDYADLVDTDLLAQLESRS